MDTAVAEAPKTDELIKLEVLIKARIIAKRNEDDAVARRRECDGAILDLLPKMSATTRVGAFKVLTSYGLTRKVDTEALKPAFETLPPAAQGAFRWKAEVDEKAFKALTGDDKLAAAKFITTTDSSPSLKLEV